jgi:thiol-disulfide isomerase/thioredoxin
MNPRMKRWALAGLLVAALAALQTLPSCDWLKEKPGGSAGGGREAPNVTFKSLDGSDLDLRSLRGKVVVVNFWATWCEPCQIEIPWMIGFQQEYGPRGFTIVGVAMDDEGKSVVQPFVNTKTFDVDGRKMAMNYPIVLGNDEVAQKFGGLIGLPTSFVIDRNGKIVKKYLGLVSKPALDEEIKKLL